MVLYPRSLFKKSYLHKHACLFLAMIQAVYKISNLLKEKRPLIYLPNDCTFSISDVCSSVYLAGLTWISMTFASNIAKLITLVSTRTARIFLFIVLQIERILNKIYGYLKDNILNHAITFLRRIIFEKSIKILSLCKVRLILNLQKTKINCVICMYISNTTTG